MTVWPSGLRRWLQAPVRKGVGSNPTAVTRWNGANGCPGGERLADRAKALEFWPEGMQQQACKSAQGRNVFQGICSLRLWPIAIRRRKQSRRLLRLAWKARE